MRRRPLLLVLLASTLVFLCYVHSSRNPSLPASTPSRRIPPHLFSDFSRNGITSQPAKDPLPRPNMGPGAPKPPGSNYSRALVIPRLKKEDVDWIDKELAGYVEPYIYVVDDPSAPLHPPLNKGHEAMVYLSYIIDHYESLPDIAIFMHSHRISWHNEEALVWDAVELIKRLSSERLMREGYMNMRCNWGPGCPDWMHPGKLEVDPGKQEETMLARSWSQLFPRTDIPQVLAQPCCAQFAVSRDRILANPKSRYVFYRDWLLRTELSDYISGRVWEYLWHVVFTGKNVFCPEQHICYCDGFGLCFGGPKGMDAYFGLTYQTRDQQRDLDDWRKKAKAIEDAGKEGKPPEEIAKMEAPEPGKDKWYESEIKAKKARLKEMVAEAKKRGESPQIRAEEAGRLWKEGDGF
ncbi:hypothetical protein FQN51_001448 [Onygenales sp. PD_10]|nr:hypothetical protein FQN51_001448 [Onygenales sp. PD_10]